MKKHIIIAGVPRAGKSTICKRIAHELGYQHISMDSIIAGIEKVFPETRVNSNADVPAKENLQFISSKMGPYLRAMMNSGEYNECDYGMVIDIYQLLPEDYVRYIDSNICDIYYFLSSDVTAEERYDILKEKDTPDDYTYYKSDDVKRELSYEVVEISDLLKKQCQKHQLPFYETTKNREDVINQFMSFLVLQLM